MTDQQKLPGWALRDISNVLVNATAGLEGDAHRALYMASAVLNTEAARREAEAKELGRTLRGKADVAPSSTPLKESPQVGREGPGSADAVNPRAMAVVEAAEDRLLAMLDKPAPAADDLVERLRTLYAANGGMWREFKEAADRIEAQAREIAIQAAALEGMETGARRLRDERDALKARVDEETQRTNGYIAQAIDARKAQWKAEARVARLTEAQAREIADLRALYRERDATANRALFNLTSTSAERDALKARVARLEKALQSLNQGFTALIVAALAEANDAG